MPDPALALVLKRPFAEQVAFFRRKLGNLVPTQRWDDLWKSAHDTAFMVAGAQKADLLADLASAVEKAIVDGIGIGEFRKQFDAAVDKAGWSYTGERNWRTRVIYQTNISTSYAAGREAQIAEGGFPFKMYKHSDSVLHPRPLHQSWDGLVLPVDHPFWTTHSAPNGWGCKCRIIGIRNQAAARRLGGRWGAEPPPDWADIDAKTGEPVGIDKGWGYQPGASVLSTQKQIAAKVAKLPEPLASALKADVDSINARPWPAAPDTEEGKWHDASFANSPQWIKDAVAKRGVLKNGVISKKTGAHYMPGRDYITMGTKGDLQSLGHQGTWRHEYGHAIDFNGLDQRSAQADFTAAMQADAKSLVKSGGHGLYHSKPAQAARARLANAYSKASSDLLDDPDPEGWLKARYAQSGLDYDDFKRAMSSHTDFANTLQGVGLRDRYGRAIVAIEEKDAQGLIDALSGGNKDAHTLSDPHRVERRNTFNKGIIGKISDLFGSATKNKVSGYNNSGAGHSTSYYRQKGNQETECFANLTCLYGDENPVFGQMVDALVPNMAKLFKEILK